MENLYIDLHEIITLKGKSLSSITELGRKLFSTFPLDKKILKEYRLEIELGKNIDISFKIKIEQIRRENFLHIFNRKD